MGFIAAFGADRLVAAETLYRWGAHQPQASLRSIDARALRMRPDLFRAISAVRCTGSIALNIALNR
jgi:hypothetical protein